MFTRYARKRDAWRRSEIRGTAGMIGGLAFATLIAMVGLTAVASAQPIDAEVLARMLAAPQADAAGDWGRTTLLAVMGGSLVAMAGTCLMLWQSMIRDLETGARARR